MVSYLNMPKKAKWTHRIVLCEKRWTEHDVVSVPDLVLLYATDINRTMKPFEHIYRNTHGIRMLKVPSNAESAQLRDIEYEENIKRFHEDLRELDGKHCVLDKPFRDALCNLHISAPKTGQYLSLVLFRHKLPVTPRP